jgi:hypothetical protein
MDFEQYRVLCARLGVVFDEFERGDDASFRTMHDMLLMIKKQLKHDYPAHDEKLNSWMKFDE